MMWLVLFGGLFLIGIAGVVFIILRIRKSGFIHNLSHGNKAAAWMLSVAVFLIPTVLCGILLGYMNAIIAVLHLALFWVAAEILQFLVKKCRKKKMCRSYAGGIAILITVIYLGAGMVQAYHVWQTDYSIQTSKIEGSLRIALIADSHMGTTFHGSGFRKHVQHIMKQKPDIVVIAGDFVDEDSSREDMTEACRALKDLDTPYGTYFVFGNHDKGNYGTSRGYTGDDLAMELKKNGVTVLQDENVPIGDDFYLIGRQDASEELDFGGSRADIGDLMQGLDRNRFSIVLDHQPCDYDAETDAGADLVLSGHTHGGQMIPLMQLMRNFHIGGTDNVYGKERHRNTDFIVTSGISDWAVRFKTGCRSEYVMIDINGN